MDVESTALNDAVVLTPKRFGDARGFFMEVYNKPVFDQNVGYAVDFMQDNHSRSDHGVLRGLHYQMSPYAQGKLVRCVVGEIFDVAVDLRRQSSTFGQWTGVYLSAENASQLWVPPGFAHGFLVTSASAEVTYKVDAPYSPESERAIIWNDATIGIRWPDIEVTPTVSDKDGRAPSFDDADLFDRL